MADKPEHGMIGVSKHNESMTGGTTAEQLFAMAPLFCFNWFDAICI